MVMLDKKEIIIMNEGVTYDVADVNDCVKAIHEEYCRFDNNMYDLLAVIQVKGFSIQDVASVYSQCMKISNSDTILDIK